MTSRTWSPKPTLVGLSWLLAACATGWALLTQDRAALLLAGVAAGVLALLALHGTVARPRLSADAEGLTVRGLTGSRRWAWPAVTLRVVRTRRLGRESPVLELDLVGEDGVERLVVFTRLDLGAEPDHVAESLTELRH